MVLQGTEGEGAEGDHSAGGGDDIVPDVLAALLRVLPDSVAVWAQV